MCVLRLSEHLPAVDIYHELNADAIKGDVVAKACLFTLENTLIALQIAFKGITIRISKCFITSSNNSPADRCSHTHRYFP